MPSLTKEQFLIELFLYYDESAPEGRLELFLRGIRDLQDQWLLDILEFIIRNENKFPMVSRILQIKDELLESGTLVFQAVETNSGLSQEYKLVKHLIDSELNDCGSVEETKVAGYWDNILTAKQQRIAKEMSWL